LPWKSATPSSLNHSYSSNVSTPSATTGSARFDSACQVHVELDEIRLEVGEQIQAGMACAEIVDRNLQAQGAVIVHSPCERSHVADRLGFRHLHDDPIERKAVDNCRRPARLVGAWGVWRLRGRKFRFSRHFTPSFAAMPIAVARPVSSKPWRSSGPRKVGLKPVAGCGCSRGTTDLLSVGGIGLVYLVTALERRLLHWSAEFRDG